MKRWLSPVAWAGLLLAQACAADDQSGVLLTVLSPGEAPTSLEVLWLDGDNHLLLRRRLPEAGELSAQQAGRFTLFIELAPGRLGSRRVVGYGKIGDRTISQGIARIDGFTGGRRDVEVVLGADPLPDRDGDGLPDEVDACPTVAAADGRCPDEPDASGGITSADAAAPLPPTDPPTGAPTTPDAAAPPPPAPAPSDAGAPEVAPPTPDAAADRAPPGPPAVTMGTFTKSTGPAGSEQRVGHTLGAPPRAILLWTAGRTGDDFGAGLTFSMGMSEGPGGLSRAVAFASADGAVTSQASRRIVDNLLSVGRADGSTAAAADLVAWDATSFTLRWSTSNASAYIVHAVVIGGDAVTARVIDWLTPVADGALSIEGVGFPPEVVMNLHVGLGFTAPVPAVMEGGSFGLGVMTRAGRQWANAIAIPAGALPTDTRRVQRTEAAIYMLARDQEVVAPDAVLRSMDADGFSLDFRNARPLRTRVISLALGGIAASAGAFLKPVGQAPQTQEITGVGLRPGLVLLSSVEDRAQLDPTASARFVLGASDGTRTGCTTLSDTSGQIVSSARSITSRARTFLKADQDRLLIEAEATAGGFGPGGFALRWLGNDIVPIQITYLALGVR